MLSSTAYNIVLPTISNLPFCHYHHNTHLLLSPPVIKPNFLSLHTNSIPHTSLVKKIHSFSSGSSPKSSSMASAEEEESKPKAYSVLFVCLGNICRSPAAEGVFKEIVKNRGLDSMFYVDSAGTINYHEGNPADSRMRGAAKRRGIEITSISRPVRPSDFKEFDLILAMDKQNREDLMNAFERWKFREGGISDEAANKVKLMCSYCKKHDETEVPDPYYGGQQGFEKVLDLLEDACESLLDSILAENSILPKS